MTTCDHCSKQALVIERNQFYFCAECWLKGKVKAGRYDRKNKEEKQQPTI